jgi:3',5'-nucleoside bisphosphate phosphatase
MRVRFDLHLHTTASDGLLQPEEVVRRAAACGLFCIAVTDHDTTAGVEKAREEGRKLGLPVLPGAELAADFGSELHILGYGMDIASQAWRTFASEQQSRRAERNSRMLDKMDELGLTLPEEYRPWNVPGEYGRMHMALGLVQAGYAQSVQQAFAEYLGHGAPAYVKRRKFASTELIAAIKAASGEAVLAHPGRIGSGLAETGRLIKELRGQGLDGVEAFYPSHEPEEAAYYAKMAAEAGLVCTYGSDWHGYGEEGPAQGFDGFDIPDATVTWLNSLLRKSGGFQ